MKVIIQIQTLAVLIFFMVANIGAQQNSKGALRGKVVDGFGALVSNANVMVVDSAGTKKTAQSSQVGEFIFTGLAAGRYSVSVNAQGFAPYSNAAIDVVAGKEAMLDITMTITVSEKVDVGGEDPINTSPEANASATVLKDDDLNALPDNPADLEAALQALAGPAAGPNGGEIFIDGFSGGKMPPKDSIREIRINQNPFSSEYDRMGLGRIEILTKPGSDKWKGEIGGEFEDESINSRNPFAVNRPPFQLRNINGNFGGPLIKKKASFFFDGEKEDIDNNSVINAQILGPGLVAQTFQKSLLSPLKTYEFGPRLDYQISTNNTLVARFFGSGSKTTNAGLNGFDLPSRAYSSQDSEKTLRFTDTAVISPTVIDEVRFQYIRRRSSQTSSDNSPTVRVSDAFTWGGANVGLAYNNEDRLEFQNSTTVVHGNHLIKFGARLRHTRITDASPGNFAGTFTFTTLDQYRNAILRVPGAIPTQFSIAGGNPVAEVKRTDAGLFAQDDWRLRPNLTISLGLRYETQTNISGHGDFAPRFSFAYSPGGSGKSQPKTVFRGGFGIFYDRFSEGLTLQSIRFNGTNQQQFVVTDAGILGQIVFTANGVTNVPTVQSLTAFAQRQTTRVVASNLRAPRTAQIAMSIERQLPLKTTLSATYVYSHTDRLLRSRNINAPLGGVRPVVAAGNIFQYESTGRFNQNQILFNFRTNLSKEISLFGNYALGQAKSDTEGAGSFPLNQYDTSEEYADSFSDIRHRFVLGGNIKAPLGFSLSPFLTYRSGLPFNITTGTDLNGDTLFTDRPSFATSPAEAGIIKTSFGSFDPTPEPSDTIIPRNYGRGPSFFVTNLRIAREFAFGGGKPKSSVKPAQAGESGNRTGTSSPFGGGAPSGGAKDDEDEKPYKLELSVQIRNLFNHTNGNTPVGNLGSPFFGDPVSLASGFGFGGGRQSGGNRRLRLEVQFSF
ncbi:hypothetical protein BH10ACI2_BH10ACI2_12750 [soil metagenome]